MTTLRPTPSPTAAELRSPLARVRGLGSAKEGTDHFWKQRVTAVANIFLMTFFVLLLVKLAGADHATVKRTLSKPLISALLLLMILSGVHHMRLGMQTIIEDYVHSDGCKVLALMANSFFAISIAVACIMAVLKLTLGA